METVKIETEFSREKKTRKVQKQTCVIHLVVIHLSNLLGLSGVLHLLIVPDPHKPVQEKAHQSQQKLQAVKFKLDTYTSFNKILVGCIHVMMTPILRTFQYKTVAAKI